MPAERYIATATEEQRKGCPKDKGKTRWEQTTGELDEMSSDLHAGQFLLIPAEQSTALRLF